MRACHAVAMIARTVAHAVAMKAVRIISGISCILRGGSNHECENRNREQYNFVDSHNEDFCFSPQNYVFLSEQQNFRSHKRLKKGELTHCSILFTLLFNTPFPRLHGRNKIFHTPQEKHYVKKTFLSHFRTKTKAFSTS